MAALVACSRKCGLRSDGVCFIELGDRTRISSCSCNRSGWRSRFKSAAGVCGTSVSSIDPTRCPSRCATASPSRTPTCMLFSKSPRYFFDAEAVREPHHRTDARVTRQSSAPSAPMVVPSRNARIGERWPDTGRNARSVWTIATEPLPFEHYAAFPQALVERCIKAGTSERGCCPECGAPWVREVERSSSDRSGTKRDAARRTRVTLPQAVSTADTATRKLGQSYQDQLNANPPLTTGWRPSCGHDLEPVPCLGLGPLPRLGHHSPRSPQARPALHRHRAQRALLRDRRGADAAAVGADVSELEELIAAQDLDMRTGHRVKGGVCGDLHATLELGPDGLPVFTRSRRQTANDDRHGTLYCYHRLRCRCSKCRAAAATWQREWRRKH